MARVNTYLHFARNTEAAFQYYKSVFKTEFTGAVMRYGDIPPSPGQPSIAEGDKKLIMHVSLPILGGHLLMGSDVPAHMGPVNQGNNVSLSLEPDTRAEADRLFNELSKGGKVEMPMREMFWGGYFGSFIDQFGIDWMINCPSKK